MSSSTTVQLPTLEELLVSIDVAPRAEKLELTHTVNALHERAKLDGLASPGPYLKLAILVAFRRRHHLKAMASGTGAGERCVLRTVLQCVARTHAHLVQAVLPLVPEYGSWRDVRLIGDDAHADCVELGVEVSQVETTAGTSKPEQEEGPGGGSARVFGAVAALFAQQLQRDLAAAHLPVPGISADAVIAAGESLSNAAKYAPSASRHRGALKTRRYQASHKQLLDPDSTSKDLPASPVEAAGRVVHRSRRGDKTHRGRPVSSEEAAAVATARESGHAAQKAMVKQLAAHLGLPASRAEAALRQQVVAPLNLRLTEQGYQVERLLCERRYADIKFRRAPKGSLTKYGDAIRKDPKAARRWAAIAEVSASAVPDLDDLFAFADSFLDLRGGGGDAEMVRMQRRSVSKAVDSAVAERARLTARALALLEQVKEESSSESKEGKSVTSEVLSASIINDLRANVPCLPLVDFTSIPSTRDGVALLLGAFVCLRFQERLGLQPKPASLAVVLPGGRGVVVAVPSAPVDATADDPTTTTEAAAAASDAPTDAAADEMKTEPASSTVDGDDFALLVEEVERAVAAAGGMGNDATLLDAEILAQGGRALLQSCSAVSELGGAQDTSADVMLLCSAFHAADDREAFDATVAQLQRPSTGTEATENGSSGTGTGGRVLRTLLVNRCKASGRGGADGGVPFRPRAGLRPRPENPKDVSVDVCFMLDCTGSMGLWMAAAKEHLSAIMQGLRDDAGVGSVRVAFVGYRDYRDHDRVVVADFAPLKDCARVVDVIEQQHPSGGADEPEDVACGLRACCDLAWESHVRFVVHVADATGHGLTSSVGCGRDDYPKGTPDQRESTADTVARLRDAKPGNPGADLLFCRLNDRTEDLEELYANVYGSTGGTGTLPILEGSRAFKDAVLGCLTDSLLGLMVAPDTAAVQTFDGRTLSARLNCLNASFKESLQSAGEALLSAHTASLPADAAATEDTPAVAEGGGGEVRGGEESSAAGAGTEAEEKAEVGGGGGGGEVLSAVEAGTEPEKRAPPVARGDGQRLMAELEGEDLVPLRIALGLPASAGAFTGGGLAERAASSLLDAGVTLSDLTELGYPKPIADIFQEVGAKRVKRVA
jgi:hypothetical protein